MTSHLEDDTPTDAFEERRKIGGTRWSTKLFDADGGFYSWPSVTKQLRRSERWMDAHGCAADVYFLVVKHRIANPPPHGFDAMEILL